MRATFFFFFFLIAVTVFIVQMALAVVYDVEVDSEITAAAAATAAAASTILIRPVMVLSPRMHLRVTCRNVCFRCSPLLYFDLGASQEDWGKRARQRL